MYCFDPLNFSERRPGYFDKLQPKRLNVCLRGILYITVTDGTASPDECVLA